MTATILSFGRRQPNAAYLPPKMPWQNQDLAELFRVRDRLCAAGLSVEVESGVSDEGDPWFVYQQSGTDNVVVHIARIDMEIHVVNCVTGGVYKGTSFREVSDRMLEDAPMALGTQVRRSNNVVLHPSAFLTAFVAAAIMLVDLLEHGRAEAAESHGGAHPAHDGTGHGFIFMSSHAGEVREASAAPVTETASGDNGEGATISRRVGKDGTGPVQSTASGPGAPAAVPVAAPASVASAPHGGFLAEAPGSGASFALTAGMFAAELLRVFSEESRAHGGEFGGTSFAEGFSALLSAFVSAEGSSAKPTAPLFALTDSTAPVSPAEIAPSDHHAAQISSGGSIASVAEIKALEAVHVLTAELHHAALVVEKATLELYKAVASHVSASAELHAVEAKPLAAMSSAPASETVAVPVAETAAATAKPAPINSQELAWIVSQVVKHDILSLPVEAPAQEPASDQPAPPVEEKAPAKPVVTPAGPDIVSLEHGPGKEMVAHLVSGHAEIVQYAKGSVLTVEGFVLGEDLLSFGTVALGDAMAGKAHAEGADLVLGDAETGQVRLVGVLSDPSLLGHHGAAPAAA